MPSRGASNRRKTKETDVTVEFYIDGTGESAVDVGIGFFGHMLESFARHGFFDLRISCTGDLNVDCHHTVEDVGLTLGKTIADALGDKKGIRRFGSSLVPMDDALALCAVDLSGRPYLNFDAEFASENVGSMATETVREFFYAVCCSACINLHIKLLDGKNDHHKIEAIFKAFARALDEATGFDARIKDVLTTKGSL